MGVYAKGLLVVSSIMAVPVAIMQFAWIGQETGAAVFRFAVSVACTGVGVLAATK